MIIRNMRNFPNYLNKYSSLEKLEQKIRNLYKNKQYLNIISLFEVNIKILALRDMDLCFFNYTVSSLMYIAMAYFSLERYDKSLEIFNEIESRYNALNFQFGISSFHFFICDRIFLGIYHIIL